MMRRRPAVAATNLAAKAWRRLRAAHKPLVRLSRRAARRGEHREVLREVATIERELERIAQGRGPILVGPWLAEVGYETLYWVPFLRWFADAYRIRRERLVVVSRGGVFDWYADFASRYVDIFDLIAPADLLARNDARKREVEAGGQKQTSTTTLDDDILRQAGVATGVSGAALCHPSLMFRLFRHVWHDALPFDYFWTHTRYRCVDVPAPVDGLPSEFSVAKFYTGTALPSDAPTIARVRELVAREAARRPVIVMDTGVAADEHEDYRFDAIPNVISARPWMTPSTNLGVQTRLTARASLFLGTCGGLAWLAPFLGTPTIGVYADDTQLASHLFVARQATRRVGAAPFLPLDLRVEPRIGR